MHAVTLWALLSKAFLQFLPQTELPMSLFRFQNKKDEIFIKSSAGCAVLPCVHSSKQCCSWPSTTATTVAEPEAATRTATKRPVVFTSAESPTYASLVSELWHASRDWMPEMSPAAWWHGSQSCPPCGCWGFISSQVALQMVQCVPASRWAHSIISLLYSLSQIYAAQLL